MWHVLHINNIIIFLFCFLNWIKKKKEKKKLCDWYYINNIKIYIYNF